jgi:SM-20-related protein
VQDAFEHIIDSYLSHNAGEVKNFLSDTLSNHLRDNLLKLLSDNQFKAAGIGNNTKLKTDKLIRSDVIYWLSREHNDVHENSFFDLMDAFVVYLNSTCYTGITGYEFHYAYYDTGTFYKRHLDQFKDNNGRAFSMIMYLNDNWQIADGGQLCIYHNNKEQLVSPMNGTGVFFKSSELEHEVLLSHKPRMSITGWLRTG